MSGAKPPGPGYAGGGKVILGLSTLVAFCSWPTVLALLPPVSLPATGSVAKAPSVAARKAKLKKTSFFTNTCKLVFVEFSRRIWSRQQCEQVRSHRHPGRGSPICPRWTVRTELRAHTAGSPIELQAAVDFPMRPNL